MGVRKKGFFFTVDAMLAASILLGGILILSGYYANGQPTMHLNYLSQDILNSLDMLKLSELNNSYVGQLYANGTITDLNNSVLQQIGEFWAAGKYNVANEFVKNITKDIIPTRYGFGIWINEETIYQRDSPAPSSRATARKMISGIEKNKPIKGYMSKARANSYTKTSTQIISFSPEGAGWGGISSNPGEAVIDKYFSLPFNINMTGATFYISLHIERSGNDWEVINLNNGTCKINRSSFTFLPTEEGLFNIKNITGCLRPGQNNARLRLRNVGYNGHIHPGMLIKVDYNLNETVQTYNSTYSNRFYFDNIVSNEGSTGESGVWGIIPFFIPAEATDVTATAKIVGRGVYDFTGSGSFSSWSGYKNKRDYDYMFFVNGNTPFAYSANPTTNCTYYYNSSQLASRIIVGGTNTASVFFNNYGDDEWGNGHPQVYSDPFNNPSNSSYVELNYTLQSATAPYGSIELTRVKDFGGTAYYRKDINFSFPNSMAQMGDVFTHIVQLYSYMVDVLADPYYAPTHNIFASPSSRTVPTTVYIPRNRLSASPVSANYIRVSDRNMNEILPNSSVEYSFYIPSFVGYGAVFAKQSDAEVDAQARLNQTLGIFISTNDVVVESSEMRGVPSLWGPAIMEVRVWY